MDQKEETLDENGDCGKDICEGGSFFKSKRYLFRTKSRLLLVSRVERATYQRNMSNSIESSEKHE